MRFLNLSVNMYSCDPIAAVGCSYSYGNACNGVKMREFQAFVGSSWLVLTDAFLQGTCYPEVKQFVLQLLCCNCCVELRKLNAMVGDTDLHPSWPFWLPIVGSLLLGSTYMLIDCTQCKDHAFKFSNRIGSCQCYLKYIFEFVPSSATLVLLSSDTG